jgi:GNAT superfamily N-acetyltransferase
MRSAESLGCQPSRAETGCLDGWVSHSHDHPVADASVRVATPWDVDAVGDVQAVLWQGAYASLLPRDALAGATPAEFARVWRESLANPPSGAYRLLVACAGEEVVGFAAIGPSADPDASDIDAELLVGGVRPDARRAGHGSRLLNATVDTAGLTGFARVRTWLLSADRPTRGFLEAAGFVVDGGRRERVTGPAEGDVAEEVRLTVDVPQ